MDMVTTALFHLNFQVAYVEVYSGASFIWAEAVAYLLKLRNKPFVLVLHGGKLPEFLANKTSRAVRLLSLASAVVTPSRYLQQALQTFQPSIRYLPNGQDINHYPFHLRRQVTPKLCWLRAFEGTYDPIMAVKTLAAVRRFSPEATLTMIGPVKRQSILNATRQTIQALGLERYIEITGPIPKLQVPTALAQYDIFLNTTRYESFGVGVVEAAACGLPVVSTAVGELPYLWQDGNDILLVPPSDAEAMAAAVRRLLTEPELAERLSRNAREKAEQFDWQVVLPQWEKLFDELGNSANE